MGITAAGRHHFSDDSLHRYHGRLRKIDFKSGGPYQHPKARMETEPHSQPAQSAMTRGSRPDLQWSCPGIRQLPGLTKPVQDESVKSYLQRLARANRCAIEDLARYLAPHTWPHDDAKASNILIASLHDPTDDIYMAIELSALAKATSLPGSEPGLCTPRTA
jgi:hypothetical protein